MAQFLRWKCDLGDGVDQVRVKESHLTRHHLLVADHALGGEFVAVALAAHQSIVLAGEGLVGQRASAAYAAEAVFVVVPVFIEELLEEERRAGSHCVTCKTFNHDMLHVNVTRADHCV